MSIDAYLSVVVILPVRTPNSLEVEHIEVHIKFILLNQLNRQLVLTVRKRAILLVLTGWPSRLEVRAAKLGLILVWVVKLFYSVVRFVTRVTLRTIVSFGGHVRAHF